MTSLRTTARVAGGFYLLSFVSVPTLTLYAPLRDANYFTSSGSDTGVIWGGMLEMIVAFAGIGTAVALYPVLKRQHEGVALGFVGSRVVEAASIVSGVAIVMAMVTVRQSATGPDVPAAGTALAALHLWTFLLGQGFIPAVNAVLLGYLLYRSRLVPRVLPVLGLIGAPLLATSAVATLFGFWTQVSAQSGLLTLPIGVWELSLGVYLVVKGFRPSPVTAGPAGTDRVPVSTGRSD
ncbi:DUF4386 domain-containing protein [Dactylosporangium vinaceum]|uniref:DUF4386 domain-containing protein n=1 Tax=Dactylosporangium vinaceum TaxID=53362 RepID=A0ABV5MSS2_9ACTN|nr:DUF4386 domain-containing protein [Dactylosporangium vinaceum]UAC00156.1 DUF4386 domain-containing protein [Dactylosporangium vinaceum]